MPNIAALTTCHGSIVINSSKLIEDILVHHAHADASIKITEELVSDLKNYIVVLNFSAEAHNFLRNWVNALDNLIGKHMLIMYDVPKVGNIESLTYSKFARLLDDGFHPDDAKWLINTSSVQITYANCAK